MSFSNLEFTQPPEALYENCNRDKEDLVEWNV